MYVTSGEMTEETAAEVLHRMADQLTAVENWLDGQGRHELARSAGRQATGLLELAAEAAPSVESVAVVVGAAF